MNRIFTIRLALLLLLGARLPNARARDHDVVIYGATPAGITAAVAAAREGASVIVIEPTKWIGGMVTGGLASTDVGRQEVIGGLAREFFTRAAAVRPGTPLWYAEPHVNLQVFETMLREAKVEVIKGQRLKSVVRTGARLGSLTTEDGKIYAGTVFIDATYEGDLMARAGVSYIVGRESRDAYGESLAGFYPDPFRPRTIEKMAEAKSSYTHGTPAKISARDANGKLLPGINDQWLEPGAADKRTQAYNFRVILTRRADNRVPFPKPARYDPWRYELLGRIIDKFPGIRFGKLVYVGPIANDKYDANASGLVMGTDHVGANTDYPDGDYAARERIWQDHVDYVQGFLWFLANDPRVPQALRAEASEWGLAKDEFVDNGNWPYALYVREARRMIGPYVLRQRDLTDEVRKPDSIGMGSFIMDSHAVQRLVDGEGNVIDEGNWDMAVRPYQIPYRIVTPKRGQCENLLVPVCVSATHVACGSIRMEPQYMIMGHACGVAAAMARRAGKPVQEIDVKALQARLLEQKQILAHNDPHSVEPNELPGVVLDDRAAERTGSWNSSAGSGRYVGAGYLHDGNEEKGAKSARFSFVPPKPGVYQVLMTVAAAPNRATNVPVTIHAADGPHTVVLNERLAPPADRPFKLLGAFRFEAGKPAAVEISNRGTDGYVVVDAVQLLPVK